MANVDVQALEQAIRDRLKTTITSIAVEPFPARPADYRLPHPVGVCLVAYSGSEYSDPVNGLQGQDMTWVMTLLMQGAYSHTGSYPQLQAIRDCLAGWKPDGCQRQMWITRDQFVAQWDGVWQWDLLFKTTANYINGASCMRSS